MAQTQNNTWQNESMAIECYWRQFINVPIGGRVNSQLLSVYRPCYKTTGVRDTWIRERLGACARVRAYVVAGIADEKFVKKKK